MYIGFGYYWGSYGNLVLISVSICLSWRDVLLAFKPPSFLYSRCRTIRVSLIPETFPLPVNNTRLIIPGIIIRNSGRNFKYPAIKVAPLAWPIFLAANARCTITCETQYKLGAKVYAQNSLMKIVTRETLLDSALKKVLKATGIFQMIKQVWEENYPHRITKELIFI